MPKRKKGTKTNNKPQDGDGGKDEPGGKQANQGAEHKTETGEKKQPDVGGKDEPGGKQANQGAEHKTETGEEKQPDVGGNGGVIGDEDEDWKWSDGELDDDRLQAFFDERPIT